MCTLHRQIQGYYNKQLMLVSSMTARYLVAFCLSSVVMAYYHLYHLMVLGSYSAVVQCSNNKAAKTYLRFDLAWNWPCSHIDFTNTSPDKILIPNKTWLAETSLDNTEEDGWKIKNNYIEKNCSFSLNLMVKIGKQNCVSLWKCCRSNNVLSVDS